MVLGCLQQIPLQQEMAKDKKGRGANCKRSVLENIQVLAAVLESGKITKILAEVKAHILVGGNKLQLQRDTDTTQDRELQPTRKCICSAKQSKGCLC